uniref:DUF148 domain-containing protein n=1 Tax=Syphacia muris TaxID=451379 RepID=A0A0N5A9A4_9BILA
MLLRHLLLNQQALDQSSHPRPYAAADDAYLLLICPVYMSYHIMAALVHETQTDIRLTGPCQNGVLEARVVRSLYHQCVGKTEPQHRRHHIKLDTKGATPKEIVDKILEYYSEVPTETKKKWDAIYKKDCTEWLHQVCSTEEYEELKKLYQEKKTEQLMPKLNEYKQRLDAKTRAVVELWQEPCLKSWDLKKQDARLKRHTDIDTLEHHFQSNLKWLTDEQKNQLKEMKTEGKSKHEIRQMVQSFYEMLPEEKKPEAQELMKQGCKEMIQHILGEENSKKIKAMKQEGKSVAEIEAEINKLMQTVTDKTHQEHFKAYGPVCKKLFEVE